MFYVLVNTVIIGGSTEIKGIILLQFTFILKVSILKMLRILKIEKSTSFNSTDFIIWITPGKQ